MRQRNSFFVWAVCLAGLSLVAPQAHALPDTDGDERVTAKLVTDVAAIEPGGSFTVGIEFTIKPGWHLYWRYPGDSGAPPKLNIQGPDGMTLGEVRWPLPKRFDQAGGFVGYGYEKRVLLTMKATAPKDLTAGAKLELTASPQWFCCDDRSCVTGETKLALSVPVEPKRRDKPFDPGPGELPVEAASPNSPLKNFEATRLTGDVVEITMRWKDEPKAVKWMPAATSAVEASLESLKTDGGRTTVRFTVTIYDEQAAKQLLSLIVYEDKDGKTKGVYVPAKLAQDGANKQ